MFNKILVLAFSMCLFSGCTFLRIHKIDIEQGNIISPAQTAKIHEGMTKDEVEDVLGKPILQPFFVNNKLIYIYSFKASYGDTQLVKMIYQFDHNKLIHIGH